MGLSLVQIRTQTKQNAVNYLCVGNYTWLHLTCNGDAFQTNLSQWMYPDGVAVTITPYNKFTLQSDGSIRGRGMGKTCAHY